MTQRICKECKICGKAIVNRKRFADNRIVKNSRLSIFAVALMIGLLALLAVLQYRWQGQISDGERDRLQKRLQTDSKRFADDFNKEIRGAYFIFQVDPESWLEKDYDEFNQHYALWRSKTDYPKLIEDFYFVGKDSAPVRYDFERKDFAPTAWTDELSAVNELLKRNAQTEDMNPVVQDSYTLLMPNRTAEKKVDSAKGITEIETTLSGYLVIKLNKDAVNQLIADLDKHYFFDGENSDYNLSITNNQDGQTIFQTNQDKIISKDTSDAAIPLYDLSNNLLFVAMDSQIFSRNRIQTKKIITRKNLPEGAEMPFPKMDKSGDIKIQMADNNERKPEETENKGIWILNVQHRDGSLENFVGAARNKNLAISFGILGLLAASILLIFLSARRAQTLAQRQLDFVSAVSHEFRTPLAVIYSAGENLTDGVVNSKTQIEKYGGLIKGEGKKLSAMVEQILEFAGARSGKRKYDFRNVEINTIIENAFAECRPLIDEKDFEIEKDINENLPPISGDENALSQAIQNLIANALKYSGDGKKLKISAKNSGGEIKIAVEDDGIGIAPKDLRQIFQPFYRAKDVVDAQIHGNGLGLSLVRQTVEAHGGKIEVESKIGQGSRFILHLPLNGKL